MAGPLKFSIHRHRGETRARLGRVETPHGGFDTPAFMPVGTKATVKGLTPQLVRDTGSQIILNNAFHLLLRPGDELVAQLGGVHNFMRWNGPILTDSGGYQAFSLAEINTLNEDGVTFQSIVDGSRIHLGPERSMQVQNNLGADIIMAFDDCPPAKSRSASNDGSSAEVADGADGDETNGQCMSAQSATADAAHFRRVQEAHERTIRWLRRCVKAHARPHEQALFGIVQGGTDFDLRTASVEAICNIELPGYAIGGVAVGESPELIHAVVRHTAPLMPADKPRYLMGVGYERDIVAAVMSGVDMFDCVLPTRNGRTGHAFTRTGRIQLRNAIHREDTAPIEAGCDCLACSGGFGRAYLRHLFQSDEMLGPILVSVHNIRHFQRLMLDIRHAIREDAWSLFRQAWPVAFAGVPQGAGTASAR